MEVFGFDLNVRLRQKRIMLFGLVVEKYVVEGTREAIIGL